MERGAFAAETIEEATPHHGVASILCNIALAGFYSLFVIAHFVVPHSRDWTYSLPIVIQETVMVVLFLTRRPSSATTSSPVEWGVAVAGTLLPMLLRPTTLAAGSDWCDRALGTLGQAGVRCWAGLFDSQTAATAARVGRPLLTIGVVLSTLALLSIGRSIGVVPATRGIKTSGAFRVVRHPVYAAYIVSFTGYWLCSPSPANAAVVVGSLLLLGLRAVFEERFLMREAQYRDYAESVRWRMLPGVF